MNRKRLIMSLVLSLVLCLLMTTVVSAAGPNVPSGFVEYRGHYYQTVIPSFSSYTSWADCTRNWWIGATDEGTDGTWKWVTNETWDYSNWDLGAPSNLVTENYAEIIGSNGAWNDNDGTIASGGYGYIIEFETADYL